MASAKRIPPARVRKFIIENISAHPREIAKMVVDNFGISRQAANSHLRKLATQGVIKAEGHTKGRSYNFETLAWVRYSLDVKPDMKEDAEWRNNILQILEDFPENVIDICQYGFTEMLNNVGAHSGAQSCSINVDINAARALIIIHDYGVGIFRKIQEELGLEDARHSILELSKGKLTTAPEEHSGEGIFFTSRVFDKFSIVSGEYVFLSRKHGDDWLLNMESRPPTEGTTVFLEIGPFAEQTLTEVFRRYEDDDARFSRTHVPLRLAKYEGEKLISRSQARRLLERVERFDEALLDFDGVDEIGQAFADEIFRVFRGQHPEVKIVIANASSAAKRMIDHVLADQDPRQRMLDFD